MAQHTVPARRKEKGRGHLYDAPHEFNAEMQQEAWEWLRKFV